MSEQKFVMGDRNYLHPIGAHIFSWGVLGLCGFLGTVQVFLISLFAKLGFGYEYVFSCAVLINAYVYKSVYVARKKEEAVNHYSLVTGYFSIIASFYGIPLVLAAMLSALSVDRSVSNAFVENNQFILQWISGFKLLASPVTLDMQNLKNAVHSYYLVLSALSGILMFVLGLPMLGMMSKGWSDFFNANPIQFYFLRKVGCVLLGASLCIWLFYATYTDWLQGLDAYSDGRVRWATWRYEVGTWCLLGSCGVIMASMCVGSLLNLFTAMREKNTDRS